MRSKSRRIPPLLSKTISESKQVLLSCALKTTRKLVMMDAVEMPCERTLYGC